MKALYYLSGLALIAFAGTGAKNTTPRIRT